MTNKKGFTLIELLVVIAIIALLIGLLLPALAQAQKNAKSLKDKTQIEQIHTAYIAYADASSQVLPTPGLINRKPDCTIPGCPEMPGSGPEDENQNKTWNLYSAMIAQEFFNVDIVVGPTEVNSNIREKQDYNYAAYSPSDDIYWDPTFTMIGIALPNGEAHASYASLALTGKRKLNKWRDNNSAGDPIMGTRGVGSGNIADVILPSDDAYRLSPTLLLHGGTKEWVGNIVFNDNHTEQLSNFYPRLTAYEDGSGPLTRDNIFAAEFGDGTNNIQSGDAFLGVFKTATSSAIGPIYDPLLD